MNDFQPLEFPHFNYTDVPTETIDYKAAYELQRIQTKRFALMAMKLIEAIEGITTGKEREALEQAKRDIGNILLET